jgi:hypothetical protein
MTGLWAGCTRNRGSIPGRIKRFFSTSCAPAVHPHSGNGWLLLTDYSGRGVKLTTHCHVVLRVKNTWSHTSTPTRVLVTWCLIKQRDKFIRSYTPELVHILRSDVPMDGVTSFHVTLRMEAASSCETLIVSTILHDVKSQKATCS